MKTSPSLGSERGSIPLALLVVIATSALMAALVAQVVTGQTQTVFDRTFTNTLPVADAGLSVAQFRVNDDAMLQSNVVGTPARRASEFPVGHRTIEYRDEVNDEPFTFTLYRETASEGGGWRIESTGTIGDVSRQVSGRLEEAPLTAVAAFSNLPLRFSGSNAADSYNSATSRWCTGGGTVASNDEVTFTGSAPTGCHTSSRTVDGIDLYNWRDFPGTGATPALPGGARCNHGGGNNCRAVAGTHYTAPRIEEDRLDLASPEAVAFIAEALEGCRAAGPLQPFVVAGGTTRVLEPGTYCYSSATFERQSITRLAAAATQANPVIMFVDGSLVLNGMGASNAANINVNRIVSTVNERTGTTTNRVTPIAGALRIFVLNGPVTVENHVEFGGILYAPSATCTSGTTQIEVYGSIVCDQIAGGGGFRFHYDDALGTIGNGRWARTSWAEEVVDP